MPQFTTKKRTSGFGRRNLYPRAQPSFPGLRYLKQKSSFWIAALSLIAFVSGNLIGQHGWYAFLASIWAAGDDSLIVYEGMIAPVKKVPNWGKLYGAPQDYTYRLIPQDSLVDLPPYSALHDENSPLHTLAEQTYSVAHAGDYKTGKLHSGAHDGVDIRTPPGNEVLAMGNGRVEKVGDDPAGLGLYVTIKLPNVPDPKDPKKTTDLYCTTAHLSAQLVAVDQIVRKGEVIGYSGKTGFATGAHIHVQCDDKSAPYYPYSPFTGTELREAKLTFVQAINSGFHQERIFEYSIDPMAYIEAKYPAPQAIVSRGQDIAGADPSLVNTPQISPAKKAQLAREERLARRKSQRAILGETITVRPGPSPLVSASPTPPVVAPSPEPQPTPQPAPVSVSTDVARIELSVPESFRGRSWETVRITLLDAQGNRVTRPSLKQDIVVRTAYGLAEIRPQKVSILDFKEGIAEIQVLPRGTRTVVLEIPSPWSVLSQPIPYEQ